MQSLDERLTELRDQAAAHLDNAAMCRSEADDYEHKALVLEAEIRGIETALAALQPQAGNGAKEPRRRRERRDIRALVRKAYAEGPYTEAEDLARVLNCRISQVRKAIEAMRDQDRRKETAG